MQVDNLQKPFVFCHRGGGVKVEGQFAKPLLGFILQCYTNSITIHNKIYIQLYKTEIYASRYSSFSKSR